MIQSGLLVGRDLLVSSHAGTRLPIAVFASKGAPPPMGSIERCFFALLSERFSNACGIQSLLRCDDLLCDTAQMTAFVFNIVRSKNTGHNRHAGNIRSGQFRQVVPVDAADSNDRN